MNWIYLYVGDIECRDDILEQLCNARLPLWNSSERRLAKLMYRLGPAVGIWGDTSLWLTILENLGCPTSEGFGYYLLFYKMCSTSIKIRGLKMECL